MAFKFFNIGKANAEIDSAHAAADAALTAAKISTLKVDGKDVSAVDAPLAVKIAAVAALASSGEKTQDVSELIASNGQIAAQVEELTGKLTVATATIASQTQKISSLESELATSKSSVTTLTAENAGNKNLLSAANAENVRVTGLLNASSLTISQFCLKADCLSLTDGDGKPLAKDATEEQKLSAADKIPVTERLTALFGAVNAAVAKTGVSFAAIPAAVPGGTQAGAPKFKNATELCAAAAKAKAEGKPTPQFQSFKK